LAQGDEAQALKDFNHNDEAGYLAFQNALRKGDGNAAAHQLTEEVKAGKLSKGDAAALGFNLQQTANQHGGGKINHKEAKALEDALGDNNVLAPGKTRAEVAYDKWKASH
jgi:hypothetical protein